MLLRATLALFIFLPSLSFAAALTDQPWCRVYADPTGDSYQERYAFSIGGSVDVKIFEYVSGNRKDLINQAKGSYKVNGPKLMMDVGGEIVNSVFRVEAKDPQTSSARLYITNGREQSIYDPCK